MKKNGFFTVVEPEAGIDLWQKILNEQKTALDSKFQSNIKASAVVLFSIPKLSITIDIEKNQNVPWHKMVRETKIMAQGAKG